jgi:hypothetical protein
MKAYTISLAGLVGIILGSTLALAAQPTIVTVRAQERVTLDTTFPVAPDLSGAVSETWTTPVVITVTKPEHKPVPEKVWTCGEFRDLQTGSGSVKECEWK